MEPELKQGYKTTEFWLALAAVIVGVVQASGVAPEGRPGSECSASPARRWRPSATACPVAWRSAARAAHALIERGEPWRPRT